MSPWSGMSSVSEAAFILHWSYKANISSQAGGGVRTESSRAVAGFGQKVSGPWQGSDSKLPGHGVVWAESSRAVAGRGLDRKFPARGGVWTESSQAVVGFRQTGRFNENVLTWYSWSRLY